MPNISFALLAKFEVILRERAIPNNGHGPVLLLACSGQGIWEWRRSRQGQAKTLYPGAVIPRRDRGGPEASGNAVRSRGKAGLWLRLRLFECLQLRDPGRQLPWRESLNL